MKRRTFLGGIAALFAVGSNADRFTIDPLGDDALPAFDKAAWEADAVSALDDVHAAADADMQQFNRILDLDHERTRKMVSLIESLGARERKKQRSSSDNRGH